MRTFIPWDVVTLGDEPGTGPPRRRIEAKKSKHQDAGTPSGKHTTRDRSRRQQKVMKTSTTARRENRKRTPRPRPPWRRTRPGRCGRPARKLSCPGRTAGRRGMMRPGKVDGETAFEQLKANTPQGPSMETYTGTGAAHGCFCSVWSLLSGPVEQRMEGVGCLSIDEHQRRLLIAIEPPKIQA